MGKFSLKAVFSGTGFLGSYSSLVIPIIIVLVAILVFIPTHLMSSGLRKQITNESISGLGSDVKSLIKNVAPKDQWKVEQAYQKAHQAAANRVTEMAEASAQRELLSYKIFPKPKETSLLIFDQFSRSYISGLEKMLGELSAVQCPSEAELDETFARTKIKRKSGFRRGSADDSDSLIREELCLEKARAGTVYANISDLSGYNYWKNYTYETGMNQSVEDSWYWQLGYWIIEDVFETIKSVNAGSTEVLSSPVKRLIGVSFSDVLAGGGSKADEQLPSYVLSLEEGLAFPCTGRISNDDIDVVHFNVVVIVSAQGVMPFMEALYSAKEHSFKGFDGTGAEQVFKHNQITIVESIMGPVERDDSDNELYRYGEEAVVELQLTCEYILNKKAHSQIKPESVKETLGESEKKEKTSRKGKKSRRKNK